MNPRLFAVWICVMAAALQAEAQFVAERPAFFYAGMFASFRAEALIQNKPYIVFYYLENDPSTANLRRFTFTDPAVRELLTWRFLCYGLDASDQKNDGPALTLRHKVNLLPTIIVFDKNGKELRRFTGYVTGKVLAGGLNAVLGTPAAPAIATASAGSLSRTSQPASAVRQLSSPAQPAALRAPEAAPHSGANSSLYRVVVHPVVSPGFGLQMGAFSDVQNALREASRLYSLYGDRIMMQQVQQGITPVYKLYLGPFNTREQAATYLASQRRTDAAKGWVVAISP